MTAAPVQLSQRDISDAQRIVGAVSDAFAAKVVGQGNLRESLLIGLLTGGHILIESVPGLAKTTAARVIAESIHGGFQRIQCTPDLLPSDIIGTQIYDSATNSFATELGPVHTNIVLLDEINRSSAKTQSAMLEAMEERQTTIAGRTFSVSQSVSDSDFAFSAPAPRGYETWMPVKKFKHGKWKMKWKRYSRPPDGENGDEERQANRDAAWNPYNHD